MKHLYLSAILLLGLISLQAQTQPDLEFVIFKTGFSSPTAIANAGDDRLFVVERDGVIKVIDNNNTSVFLDINNIVSSSADPLPGYTSELGLLGLAFHPDYANNGYFFVNYTDNSQNTQISRFSVDAANPNLADVNSEVLIINIDQPYSNHNGGGVEFGPDGYLYIGMGDGGSGGDPDNYAQNNLSQLGKLLRIDVDNGQPYTVPADNPFVGVSGYADEIWASGLRNPWRFTFDSQTGDLWIGDVGQNAWEEINFQAANSQGGEDYGWRCYEGLASFNSAGCNETYTDPIHVYVNDGFGGSIGCSVTGGYVYRGTQFPNLVGHYVFADYCTGRFYTLYDNMVGMGWTTTTQSNSGYSVSTFGQDNDGELYFADLVSGIIYKINDVSVVSTVIEELQTPSFFPNPATAGSVLYLDKISSGDNFIHVLDVKGRTVFSQKGENRFQLPHNLANGLYMIQLNNRTPNTLIIQND